MTFKISALPLSNVYDTFTFEFFPLEWTTPPPVSLLKSLTITNFILRVNFFPLFKVSGTIHSHSLLHSDPNVTCELRSNGSDLAPTLLRRYCSCKFTGKMFSISAACCWKSNHVIVNDTMSSFWLPLALSSILNVIWNVLSFIVSLNHMWKDREIYHHLPQPNCLLEGQVALVAVSWMCRKLG